MLGVKEIICRKCFAQHPLAGAAYGCQNDTCSQRGTPVPAPENRIPPSCKECGEHLDIFPRLCPDCGFPIPGEDEMGEHLGISIVGAEGCGKSHYLSVLIEQIRQSMSKAYNCALYPLGGDRTMDHYDEHYYAPIFVRGECIPSTAQDDVDPLVYSLVFSKNGERKKTGKSCSLTFYDACGANFERENIMLVHNRSVCNARGILFLIDPSQLPGLREEYLSRGLPVCEEDAFALLSRTVHLIRTGMKKRLPGSMGGKIEIPIAICVTKTDTLQQRLDVSSFLRYPSRHLEQPQLDTFDFESCSLEVQSLLENWAGRELINQISSQFSKFGFFGFSALGTAPHDETRISRVSPHRVLDPLLWILWRNHIINGGGTR